MNRARSDLTGVGFDPWRFRVGRSVNGFTLIEMIVVISVIGLLAALIFPLVAGARNAGMRTRTRAELIQLETSIEEYKTKLGFYPPDNAPNWAVNQLYYELSGTTNMDRLAYRTLDGANWMSDRKDVFEVFYGAGTPVSGFLNCSRSEEAVATCFVKNLKPGQWAIVWWPWDLPIHPDFAVLAGPIPWPGPNPYLAAQPQIVNRTINPWCYNSSNPRFNHRSYDLWIDIVVGGKTNRICNWSERPLIVSTLYP